MSYQPSPEQVAALTDGYRRIPVSKTMPMGTRTPIDTFLILKNVSRAVFYPGKP